PNACVNAAGVSFCTDLSRDSGNCGVCGHACPAGTTCAGAMCWAGAPTCMPPLGACPTPGGMGSVCADLMHDPGNCGGCGHVCPAGVACQAGVCGQPMMCAPPSQMCTDAPTGKTFCADTAHDPGNCGGCGKVCPSNAVCTAGACQGGGGSYPGLAACPGTSGAPLCTNLLSDPGNCGACGHACPGGQGCYGGTCASAPPAPTCPPDAKLCLDPSGKMFCANLLGDPGNCGGC